MSVPLSSSNIDPGRIYVYRSTNPDYCVAVEYQIRVLGRSSRAIIAELLQQRTFRTGDQPPDWRAPDVTTLMRLPLDHTVDTVAVSSLPA
jgi:hypothetical protein